MASTNFGSSPYLPYAIGANGVFSLGLGVAALINPLQFLAGFDLKVQSAEARKVAKDLLIVYGARDIALGFGLTSAAYHGHREIMGWSMVGVTCIALIDGFVSKGNREGGQWKHWFFVGTSLSLAAAAFGFV